MSTRSHHTDDDLSPPPRSTHTYRSVTLFVRQLPADAHFDLNDGLPHGRKGSGMGVGTLKLTAHGVGNGVLGSQHRRQRVRLLAGAGHPDQRDHLRVPEGSIDQQIERSGVLAEQVWG
jgi:hypothetical protein